MVCERETFGCRRKGSEVTVRYRPNTVQIIRPLKAASRSWSCGWPRSSDQTHHDTERSGGFSRELPTGPCRKAPGRVLPDADAEGIW